MVNRDDTQCTKNKVPDLVLLVTGVEMWTNHGVFLKSISFSIQ